MNRLTIKKGNIKYDMNIEYVKYCLGFNYEEKFNFMKILKEACLHPKESEYTQNNTGHAQVLINDEIINPKTIQYFHVSTDYSLLSDLKLTSQSIVAKYLEVLISQNDNTDTINTINLLLESFSSELDSDIILSRFITYTPKQFLKILLPVFLKEEEQANEYDLTYEELILLQLKMIDFISKNQIEKARVMNLIEIPVLTRTINDYLNTMNQCLSIIILNNTKIELDINHIYLFDHLCFDLNDENILYNVFLEKGICTLQEAKAEMKKLINNKLDMSIINR